MKVDIIEPKGYCSGVRRAIEIALKAKADNSFKSVFVLGMLVHNRIVVDKLKHEGINFVQSIEEIPNNNVIIFTAHGHDEKLDAIANKKHLIIYDAVCPKVHHNAELIKNELSNNHQIIYIGIKNHPETNAALSIDKNVFLYDLMKPFDFHCIDDISPLVINQTTLNILDIQRVYDDIKSNIPLSRIQNEICNSTRMRQEALLSLDDDVDMIVVVGDKASSNSNRLFDIANQYHPNIDKIMISCEQELPIEQIKNKKHIIISSGASSPDETIYAIYQKITNSI